MSSTVDRLVRHCKKEGPVVLLESQSNNHSAGKVTYIAALPQAVILARDTTVTVRRQSKHSVFEANPWNALAEFRREHRSWMFGYLGYDLKNTLEALYSQNPDPVGAPDMYFMIPGLVIKIDHRLNDEVQVLKGRIPADTGTYTPDKERFDMQPLRSVTKREEYIAGIRKAQRRIAEGDFYEVNLSHQMQSACTGDSYGLYRSMRSVGPVPFGAYLQFDEWGVCCLSPERFLKRDGRRICSQPIKGTIQRGDTPAEDLVLKEELKASLKNRAENLMIVDLVRNDLSRIAVKNSVIVPELFEIQTFGTVHQMVSTIEAETQHEDPVEIIRACYPMGSMTGAPKISAMRCIEELETYRRGIYSGSIGYIDPDGNFDFNVVIRTAVVHDEKLWYSVGGAITGDSDPEDEWEETMIKARALTRVVQ